MRDLVKYGEPGEDVMRGRPTKRLVDPFYAERLFNHAVDDPMYLTSIMHRATGSLERIAGAIKEGRENSFWLQDIEEGNPLMDYHREGLYLLHRILKTPEASDDTFNQSAYALARSEFMRTFLITTADMNEPQKRRLYEHMGLQFDAKTNGFSTGPLMRRGNTLQ